MRYIRTKDGRIAEIKENMVVKVSDDATRLVYKKEPYICVLNGDDDILKQADTIKELCDLFYVESNADRLPSEYMYFEAAKVALGMLREYVGKDSGGYTRYLYEDNPDFKLESDVYGAIYIKGKGYIYVAKMNEKGELELL